MNDYMTLLHKHKINGGFLAPDRIPMEERNKNEMILELQNEVHIKDKEIERLNNIINDIHNGLEQIIEQGYDYNEKDKIAIKLISKIRELKGDSSNE